jgi:hypothetical protein
MGAWLELAKGLPDGLIDFLKVDFVIAVDVVESDLGLLRAVCDKDDGGRR